MLCSRVAKLDESGAMLWLCLCGWRSTPAVAARVDASFSKALDNFG